MAKVNEEYTIKKHEGSGLNYRVETTDFFVIDEVKMYRKFYDHISGMKVLDLGANIGSFAHLALENGAESVQSFEPDEGNVEMYKSQYHYKEGLTKIHQAAVKAESGTASFYVNDKRSKVTHSTYKPVRGRREIQVKAIGFENILKKIKPDAVKIDIEGEEFNLDLSLLLKYDVKVLAIEVHTLQNREEAIKVFDWLKKNFTQLNGSRITGFSASTFIGVKK